MKKVCGILSALALMSPAYALSATDSTADLQKKIDMLSKELDALKLQMKDVAAKQDKVSEESESMAEKIENAVGKSNLEFSGDFRFRVDSTRADVPEHYTGSDMYTAMTTIPGQMANMSANQLGQSLMPMMPMLSPAMQQQMGGMMQQWDNMSQTQRAAAFGQAMQQIMGAITPAQRAQMMQMFGYTSQPSRNIENDLLYTNRLRLNMNANASENLAFKGRLAMYKIWGMETSTTTAVPFGMNGFVWDPNISRRPHDNTLRVEMAYANWENIGGIPMWFSVGRRPTVDGPPLQLKENLNKRYATPVGLGVDWTFDGLTIGYGYSNPFPGKVRICYGRGYESGFKDMYEDKFDDTDLYGVSWDIIDDKDRDMFANVQLFRAADIPNYMEATMPFVVNPQNPNYLLDMMPAISNGMYKGYQVGDIYHASGVFMHKINGIDYFVSAGLSKTDNNFVDKNGLYPGLMTAPGEDENRTGWAFYAGVRIPVEALNSKVGFEYNYGSRYWITFTPAADDLYQSKLSTRGHVAEAYWIYTLPEKFITKSANAFIRAGYQYYWMNYTGSGNWMGKPVDVNELNDPMNAQQFTPVDRMDNAYVTFEVFF